MRRSPYRKNTGSAWAAGFGVLGLLVTTAIIIYMFSKETDTLFTPGTGTVRAEQQAKKLLGTINERNADVDATIAKDAGRTPAPSASPSPEAFPSPTPAASAAPSPMAATAPAAPSPSPAPAAVGSAGGSPSGGEIIGPISPISPVAPIQEGAGPNLRPAKKSANGINDAMDARNKELEKALEEK